MNPEKEIVNLWLNRKGFFTIKDINAGKRVIDIIAIKQVKDGPEVQHVEVNCTISQKVHTSKEKEELLKKFNDEAVKKTVKKSIKEYLGTEAAYHKVLVSSSDVILENVHVTNFSEVLSFVVKNLDKQNYGNPTTRTMQLVKYQLMSDPERIAALMGQDKKHKSLTYMGREEFLSKMLKQDVAKKIFRKSANEKILIELLKESTLKQPERLAKALNDVLTKRTSNKFFNVLLKQKGMKEAVKEEIVKDQKSLASFLK
ncbi:MAG: hypothetical protein GY861_27780 [bacterium]|nr:hypothetical protein [bacterium]